MEKHLGSLTTLFGEAFKPLLLKDDSMIQISGWVSPDMSGLSISVLLNPRVASNGSGGYKIEHDYFLSIFDEEANLTSPKRRELQVSTNDIEASLERGSCAIVAALANNEQAREFLRLTAPRLWSLFERAEIDECMKDAPPESSTPFESSDPFGGAL